MTFARIHLWIDTLRRVPRFWGAALTVLVIAAAAFSITRGAVHVPFGELWSAATDQANSFHTVVWEVRIPRVLVAMLAGASLAISGCLLQTVVRNPLADPALLGVTAGAGVAALLTIVMFPAFANYLPLCAFGGAMLAVGVILLLAFTGARPGPLKIILCGVAIQSVLFSAIALINFFHADKAPSFVAFTVGSFNGAGWHEVRLILIPAVIGISLALLGGRALNVLLFDDATAGGVGLDVLRTRLFASALAALLAAGAVSVAGLLGFVGLVVPNVIRLISGPDHRNLLTLSALGGAVLAIVADLIARTIAAPLEIPVGALLALVGGPHLLILLRRKMP